MFGTGFCEKDRYGNYDMMDVDGHGLCHLQQIKLIAVVSDHRTGGTFPPDVQLSGDLFTHHADHRSAMDEHGKFLSVYLSENGWRGPGVAEFSVSCVICQAGEGRNVSDSEFLWCSQGPGSNSFVLGN